MSKVVKRLITVLLCLVIFAVIATIVLSAKERVKNVDVVSNDTLLYVSKQSLIDSLLEVSHNNWFSVNIEDIEMDIYNKPGVDYTLVKKIWPSTLILYIYDRKPLAYWNGGKILLDNMDIIEPEVFNYNGYLPMLISEDSLSREYIYDTYITLNKIAKENNDDVSIVSYQGNQFYVVTSAGYKIYLGSKNTSKKLTLFYDTYKNVKDFANVEYFDMRYSNGFSVKYL